LLIDTFSGAVPPAADRLEQANDAIGQGRVLMSPLAMAVVAAAIASGTPHYPRLVLDGLPPQAAPPANPAVVPPAGTVPSTASPDSTFPTPAPSATPVFSPAPDDRPTLQPLPYAAELNALMQLAVRRGTGDVLNGLGSAVGATNGTALYGSDTEPGKHAWMVGFAGSIAFAVVVERGVSGPVTAGPIARSFLSGVL
ncbi:MAG TPA: hypothetical protein VMZ00_05360, partial [Sporichthya sp.]|nr:hypothetical protein [Sporichthya sp.]